MPEATTQLLHTASCRLAAGQDAVKQLAKHYHAAGSEGAIYAAQLLTLAHELLPKAEPEQLQLLLLQLLSGCSQLAGVSDMICGIDECRGVCMTGWELLLSLHAVPVRIPQVGCAEVTCIAS